MKRRKAMKLAAGAIAGGGAGIFTLSSAFKPEYRSGEKPKKLESENKETSWKYYRLDSELTANLAYEQYSKGSCMYAVFISVVSQLADKFGEPYASFPFHMMKYGHGGIGGYGTTCGALNGGAAIFGIFVEDKKTRDALITDLFQWYEQTRLPEFKPQKANFDFNPPVSAAESTLCHASTTKWGKDAGYKIGSDQRKERCRRLTSDVAAKVSDSLNKFFDNTYITCTHNDEAVNECMTCHGSEGKLGNTSGKMSCNSCHSESAGHKVFA
ncbi:MAG: C-GCAxxG-C-C family (seleno)protein, partial [bacterium]